MQRNGPGDNFFYFTSHWRLNFIKNTRQASRSVFEWHSRCYDATDTRRASRHNLPCLSRRVRVQGDLWCVGGHQISLASTVTHFVVLSERPANVHRTSLCRKCTVYDIRKRMPENSPPTNLLIAITRHRKTHFAAAKRQLTTDYTWCDTCLRLGGREESIG